MTERAFWNTAALIAAILLVILIGALLVPSKPRAQQEELTAFSCGYLERQQATRGVLALAQVPAPSTTGLHHVLVVNGSTAQMDGAIGPFWTALSGGKLTFAPADSASASFSAAPCELKDLFAGVVAALDDRVDWTQYQQVIVNSAPSGCGYSGIGGTLYDVATNDGLVSLGVARFAAGSGDRLARHEFGHAIAFGHSSSLSCVGIPAGGIDSCSISTYGGYDIMGAGSYGLMAQHRAWAGWLESSTLAVTATGTYTIPPLGPPGSGLRVHRAVGSDLWIEYGMSGGATLSLTYPGYYGVTRPIPLQLYAASGVKVLAAGAGATDPGTGGHVTTLAVSTSDLTVEIDPGVPDDIFPVCSMTAPVVAPQGAVTNLNPYTVNGGSMPLAVDAADDRGIWRAWWRVNQGGYWRVSLEDRDAPYEALLNLDALPYDGYTVLPSWAYDAAGNRAHCGTIAFQLVRATPTPTPILAATVTRTPTPRLATPTRTPTRCHPWKRCRTPVAG